ncbi:MAG: dicarboxylate/amino acid:cation symporter [Chlamydiota bacterium]
MKPWLKILIGLLLGTIVGLVLNRQIEILDLIGKAFIKLLKMLVGLIVFSSLVTGMCHISDPKKLGRIGLRTLLFYALTTLVAIGIGLVMVYVFQPGKNLQLPIPVSTDGKTTLSLLDFAFSIVPSNPFAAFNDGNILQIIVFAIFFALAIQFTGEKGKVVLAFIESLSEVMAKLTHLVMKFAPYGVFALIATAIGAIGSKVILPLLWAVVAIFCSCVVQIAVVFTLSLRTLAKVKVAPFFKGMKDAIIVAFTTSSSSATLPISLECARNHLGLSSDISGFVLSLGSTINMNGTAIGQTVLALFIAQAYGIEVSAVGLFILAVTTLVSAIGTAGIPGSGLVMLSVVLGAMGLPLEGIALVAGIDRLRDIFATVVNIMGDAVAAVYVAKKENQIDETQYHRVTWAE